MVEHIMEFHEGTKAERSQFKVEVMKRFVKPLERQIFEGHQIQNFKDGTIMNRKGEWGQNLPPKFTVEEAPYLRVPGKKNGGRRQPKSPKKKRTG